MPSLSMVGKLAAALQVSVVDLFNDQHSNSEQDWILREKSRKTINYPDGKVTSQLLVSRISNRKIEPLLSVIHPGGSSDEAEEMTHPFGTEEFVLVVKGELQFQIDGREIRVGEGDTLSFDGALPHMWLNRGKKKAEVLFVFSPPIW